MSQTHIHLLLTHLPIFASLLGGLVLAYGILAKSKETIKASYLLLVIASIGAGISYLTGEAASETVERIQGISKNAIEQHEDFAFISLLALISAGIFSVIGFIIEVKNYSLARIMAFLTLIVSLISFSLVARTGYLGGQIRHTEISSTAIIPEQSNKTEKDD